jgi:hypothetical protein
MRNGMKLFAGWMAILAVGIIAPALRALSVIPSEARNLSVMSGPGCSDRYGCRLQLRFLSASRRAGLRSE